MTVTIIANREIGADSFHSATQEAGAYVGNATADDSNTGAFELVPTGDASDLSISLTTSSDGAVDGTTVVDSGLADYGDDYFIGATVTATSGALSGETSTITDFVSAAPPTLTVSPAFSERFTNGVTYTIDFISNNQPVEVVLVGAGDAGTATFKWSHDGGSTYLGRNDPAAADWVGDTVIYDNENSYSSLIQLSNGDILAHTVDQTSSLTTVLETSDYGVTWSNRGTFTADGNSVRNIVQLQNGRLLGYSVDDMYYSDDYGVTWALLSTQSVTYAALNNHLLVMNDGNLALTFEQSAGDSEIYFCVSSDGGVSFTDVVTIASDANNQEDPCLVEAVNGDLVCIYSTDEDSSGDYELKCKISSDGGATWGSAIDILNYSSLDYTTPTACVDINGDIYVACREGGANADIVFCVSTTNGVTWGSKTDLSTNASVTYFKPYIAVIRNEIWCNYSNGSTSDLYFVRRGFWETYSANGCPVATNARKQELINDVSISWYGSGGILADAWTFDIKHQYAMEHIVSGSTSKPYRSTSTGVDVNIVIDAGASKAFYANGAAFFGCNMRTFNLQMNATDSWGSPSVDETVDFTVTDECYITEVNGNVLSYGIGTTGVQLLDNYDFAAWSWDDPDNWTILNEDASNRVTEHANGAQVVSLNTAVLTMQQSFSVVSGVKYSIVFYKAVHNSGIIRISTTGAYVQSETNIPNSDSTGLSAFNFEATSTGSMTLNIYRAETGNTDYVLGYVSAYALSETTYKDHELKGKIIRPSTGADRYSVYEIADNIDDRIYIDSTTTIDVNTKITIYQGSVAISFAASAYRYMRINIPTQSTVDGYFEIGSGVIGRATDLTRAWHVDYGKNYVYGVEMIRTPGGGIIPIKRHNRKRVFSVGWNASENTKDEILSILDYAEGNPIALIPDNTDMLDCYFVTPTSTSVQQSGVGGNRYDIGPILFEEQV